MCNTFFFKLVQVLGVCIQLPSPVSFLHISFIDNPRIRMSWDDIASVSSDNSKT